jgi:hypothetical protein
MARYFFDFRSGETVSLDKDGQDFADMEAAYEAALDILADAVSEVMREGIVSQPLAIQVRDEFGLVLELTATVGGKIFRTQ